MKEKKKEHFSCRFAAVNKVLEQPTLPKRQSTPGNAALQKEKLKSNCFKLVNS